MRTSYQNKSFSYRIGRALNRCTALMKRCEFQIASHVEQFAPGVGFRLAQIVLFVLKLAIVIGFLVFAFWLALIVLIGGILFAGASKRNSGFDDEDKNEVWANDINHPSHQYYYSEQYDQYGNYKG